MADLAQSIPVLSGQRIEVPAFATSKVENLSKYMAWDTSKHKLVSAKLSLRASQTFLSGATINLVVNGGQRVTLNWHSFQNNEIAREMDVTSSIKNGTNEFNLEYLLAYGTITSQTAIVSATLVLTLAGERTGSSGPITEGGLSDKNFWSKLGQKVKENATLVIIGGAVFTVAVVLVKTSVGGTVLNSIRDTLSSYKDR